jgi:hypothetical protein
MRCRCLAEVFWIALVLLLSLWVKAEPSDKVHQPAANLPPSFKPRQNSKARRILFVSLGIRGHAVPLMRIASEVAAQCCANNSDSQCFVEFASHGVAKPWFNEETQTNANSSCLGGFFDLGPLPEKWVERLSRISTDPSLFRGTLSVFSDLYLGALQSVFESIEGPLQSNRTTSLAVVDIGTLGAMERARAMGIPLLLHSPTIFADMFAQYEQFHWLPAFGSGLSLHGMGLADRCLNALLPRLLSVALQPALMRVNKIRSGLGLVPYRTSHQVFQDERVITSVALGFEYARAVVPQMHAYVGPILPRTRKGYALTKPLKAFVDGMVATASKLIVVRFGMTLNLDRGSLLQFKRGLEWLASKERIGVVWFGRERPDLSLPNSNDGAQTFYWQRHFLPQILLRLFQKSNQLRVVSVSACGMAAVQEPLAFGVPVLCVPMVADQADVAARLKDSGAGLTITKGDLTPSSVLFTLSKLMNDKAFERNARVLNKIMALAGGRKRAAKHVLSALNRNSSAFYLLQRSESWHKRVGVDVAAVSAALVIMVGSCFFVRWRYLHRSKYGF